MRLIHLSLLLSMSAGTASAFTAVNGLSVLAGPEPGQIEVISSRGAGPRQIWCAGAQYAHYREGAAGNTRLYIARGLAPSARASGHKSVVFTTKPGSALKDGPKPGDGGNYSVSIAKTGFNLRVAHAEGFCERIIDEIFD